MIIRDQHVASRPRFCVRLGNGNPYGHRGALGWPTFDLECSIQKNRTLLYAYQSKGFVSPHFFRIKTFAVVPNLQNRVRPLFRQARIAPGHL
jgi:hypothetical protein